jgi:3-oxoacyl-[acyl-carrier-protein] synthase II
MNKRVVITGLGVVSSIGIGWKEFWNGLLNGKSGIGPVTSFDTSKHFTHNGGEVKGFSPERFIDANRVKSLSRASQFAVSAARLALEDANLYNVDRLDLLVGTCVGTTLGSVQNVEIIDELEISHKQTDSGKELVSQVPTHSTSAAIAREFGFRGPNVMFSTACAAGNYAIGYGFDLIRLDKADVMAVGGSDPFSRVAFTGFNQLSAVAPEKCQPFDKNRKGMMVAEGAGILIIESLESALKRNAHIYAEILGYGLSCDAGHMTQPSVEGMSACMKKAMNASGIGLEDVDYVSAHGTGTSANDRTECAAIREVFGESYKNIPVSSIKSMLGHAMGAASAIEAITCALVLENDVIPPTINFETPDPECDVDCVPNEERRQRVAIALNNSYAFGGNNASLVLGKFIERETVSE